MSLITMICFLLRKVSPTQEEDFAEKKDQKLKTGVVFGFLLSIFYSHSHHTPTLAFFLRRVFLTACA